MTNRFSSHRHRPSRMLAVRRNDVANHKKRIAKINYDPSGVFHRGECPFLTMNTFHKLIHGADVMVVINTQKIETVIAIKRWVDNVGFGAPPLRINVLVDLNV